MKLQVQCIRSHKINFRVGCWIEIEPGEKWGMPKFGEGYEEKSF